MYNPAWLIIWSRTKFLKFKWITFWKLLHATWVIMQFHVCCKLRRRKTAATHRRPKKQLRRVTKRGTLPACVFVWATLCSMLLTITIARHAGFDTNDYIVLKLRIARNNNCCYQIAWSADINVHDKFFTLIMSPNKLISQSV